jgi:hypothetical protein
MIVSNYIEFNNERLILFLKKFIKDNPCCKLFPNCNHPEFQSSQNLFNIDQEDLNIIKKEYYNFLSTLFNIQNLNIIQNECWTYINYINQKPNTDWHDHSNNKSKRNFSGLLYLTNTHYGTEFKTKFYKLETIPYINRWYLWESSIQHKPIDNICTEERIVLATATIF